MIVPDYDDFYSLTDYAGQFFDNPKESITSWLSQRSTLSLIELRESVLGTTTFRKDNVPYFIDLVSKGEKIDPETLINALGLNSMYYENGNLAAEKSLYYDYVEYLTYNKQNVNQ